MGKVIDFNIQKDSSNEVITLKASDLAQFIHPKLEALLISAIEHQPPSERVRSTFDGVVVTSLCYLLSQYVTSLVSRPNDFNVTEDNVDVFVMNLLNQMLLTAKRTN